MNCCIVAARRVEVRPDLVVVGSDVVSRVCSSLTPKFADAFDQRDLKPVMEMLSEDVEVFDHVPYWFDGKPLFAKYLSEAYEGIVCASFGFRQPSCRTYGDTVGIVNAYDIFTGVGLCSAIEKY